MEDLGTAVSVILGIVIITAIAALAVALASPQAVTGLMVQVSGFPSPHGYRGAFGAFTRENAEGGCFAVCERLAYGTREHRDCYVSCWHAIHKRIP